MTREEEIECWERYYFDRPRLLKAIFAVDNNVEVLMTYAAARGERCHFWTFTFRDVEDEEQCVADWSTFLRRLRAKTGVCGLRVFEWGRTTGRFHVHAVFDRYVRKELVDHLKADLCTMGHSRVSPHAVDEKGGSYVYKELTKQFGRQSRHRLWATFGRLAGFEAVTDIKFVSDWEECKEMAWLAREIGESRSKTWERAHWLYRNDVVRQPVERGDAFEEAGGSADFEPSELQR